MNKISEENLKDIIDLMSLNGYDHKLLDNYEYLKDIIDIHKFMFVAGIEFSRLTKKVIDLPIKEQHPEYHLLKVYRYKIPDIDRLINKYLF